MNFSITGKIILFVFITFTVIVFGKCSESHHNKSLNGKDDILSSFYQNRNDISDFINNNFYPIIENFETESSEFLITTFLIIIATFISEDITIVATGLLIGQGELNMIHGIFACFLGIFVGDTGLWIIGRIIRKSLAFASLSRKILESSRVIGWKSWAGDNSGKIIFFSRFVPGTRFVTYTGAGLLGLPGKIYIFWAFVAGLIWSPLLIILSSLFGPIIVRPLILWFGQGLIPILITILILFLMIRIFVELLTSHGRRNLRVKIIKIFNWEYWPPYLVYAPVFIWSLLLGIYYRSWSLFTTTNPFIPLGGVVGESKHDILKRIDPKYIEPSFFISDPESENTVTSIRNWMRDNNFNFPIILKPDVSQRGAGVRKVNTDIELVHKLKSYSKPLVAQTYNPGPGEAGVLYYRYPDQEKGHIFSITTKGFPVITGDGSSTIKELIYNHPRYSVQSEVFLTRFSHKLDRVIPNGQTMELAIAGNHCQGTKFLDGAHLITDELSLLFDSISKSIDEFYIGRYDIRFKSDELFKKGKEFRIIELNGVFGESTNVYDPSMSIIARYKTLFQQTSIIYRIGYLNRKRGIRQSGTLIIIKELIKYLREDKSDSVSE